MRFSILCRTLGSVALFTCLTYPVTAFPEFQAWSQQNSGRFVNCGMCHAHPDGPEGVKPGQIGSLSSTQSRALNEARLAFEPGTEVESPILNPFGNQIMEQVGRREFIALRLKPAALAGKLDATHDLDGDGLPDAREYREGTDPLDAQSGNPMQLLKTNFKRQWFHIVMIALATACGLYGLNHLLKALHQLASRRGHALPKRGS